MSALSKTKEQEKFHKVGAIASAVIASGVSYMEYMQQMTEHLADIICDKQELTETADGIWDVSMDGMTGLRHYNDLQKVKNIKGRFAVAVKLQNMSGIKACAKNSLEADYVIRTTLEGYKKMPANIYRTENNIAEYVVIFNNNISDKDACEYLNAFFKSTEAMSIKYGLENLRDASTGKAETPRVIAVDVLKRN